MINSFTTEHFIITYPVGEKPQAQFIADKLEENYLRISINLQQEITKHIHIVLHANLESFHKAIGWNDAPEWVCGIAHNRKIELALNARSDVIQIAVHELTHIIAAQINSGFVPAILSEGIATYEAGQNQNNFINTLQQYPSLEELFLLNSTSENLYAFAYSLVAFIVENHGYEKIIDLLKIDFQNNQFNFSDFKDIYYSWVQQISKHKSRGDSL